MHDVHPLQTLDFSGFSVSNPFRERKRMSRMRQKNDQITVIGVHVVHSPNGVFAAIIIHVRWPPTKSGTR